MAESYIRMHNFWITIIKLCFGIICYALFCHFDGNNNLFCNDWSTYAKLRNCFVRAQIAVTACVGFTFVIEPAVIVAYITAASHYEKTPLIHVFSLAGFIAYIIGGSMIIYFTNNSILVYFQTPPYLATGSMFIITGLIYFGHFAYTLFKRIKS